MRICIVGTGYVGLVTGACLAHVGHHVICVDKDAERVRRLRRAKCPILERGLPELLREGLYSMRLRFSSYLSQVAPEAGIVLIAVGTPAGADGRCDLTQVLAVAEELSTCLRDRAVVVTKSTVPPGTGEHVEAVLADSARVRFTVASNPEFLREGSAVADFLHPDRVVIGADDARSANLLVRMYRRVVSDADRIIVMSRPAAEMTKYAANAYLATRISFMNEVAAVCDRLNVDVDDVRRGIASDARIGGHFLYPGIGYGGSCFPKDVQAMCALAKQVHIRPSVFRAAHLRNLRQRRILLRKIFERLGPDLHGRRLAAWGLAFKPDTDDIREAPQIAIVEELARAGAQIAAHDPAAMENARRRLDGSVKYVRSAYDALAGADALLLLTEWDEYRAADLARIRDALRLRLIFDGRNMYQRREIQRHGLEYHSIGRPPVQPRLPAVAGTSRGGLGIVAGDAPARTAAKAGLGRSRA